MEPSALKSEEKFTLKAMITGRLSQKQFGLIFIPIEIIMLICWTIARSLYKGGGSYVINRNMISNQGNLTDNPIGAWFFIIGTTLVGISIINYFTFMYHQIQPVWKPLGSLFLLSGITGGIGLVMVAIFPENLSSNGQLLHNIGATMAFSGLGGAVGLSLLIMSIKILLKHSWPKINEFFIIFIMCLFIAIILLFSEMGSSVQQWVGFLLMFVWINIMYLILPDKSKTNTSAELTKD
jgi:Protein of unknown function (DUF998)